MKKSDEFNLQWLYKTYRRMVRHQEHIPNTKQWQFIDRVCRAYEYSEDEDYNLDASDYRYIEHIIYDNLLRKMSDSEIRNFENEMSDYLDSGGN